MTSLNPYPDGEGQSPSTWTSTWRRRSFAVLGGVAVFALVAMPVFAGPPASSDDGAAVSREAGEGVSGAVPAADASRRRLEAGMGELGSLARDAKGQGDMVKTACIEDRRNRAQGVMELATQEMLVVRDAGADEQTKLFAREKLGAAADRMEDMVAEARNCGQDTSPEDADDQTRTVVDDPETIPIKDPTGGLGESPAPPVANDTWPFVASPTE